MLANFGPNGKCVFCDPLGEKNKVIHRAGGWRIWENPFPDKAAKKHLVMAPAHHLLGNPIELIADDFRAMGELFTWAQHESDLSPLFGDPADHWEAHLIVPDRTGNVRFALKAQDGIPTRELVLTSNEIKLGYWKQVKNPKPMAHTRLHWLYGITQPAPTVLGPVDFTNFYVLFHRAVHMHKIEGGGLVITNARRSVAFAMRFGSVKYSEGSVPHQHANVFIANPDGEVLEIPFAKEPKKIEEGFQRMLIYEFLRTGGKVEDLTPEQYARVKDRLK